MLREAPQQFLPAAGQPQENLRLRSFTALGAHRARFVTEKPYQPPAFRKFRWLRGDEPYCDPEGTHPLAIMGRCALKRPWLGGAGLTYAEREVR